MKPSRLAEVRQALRLMDGVTPAAALANELLAEVDRLRGKVPPERVEPRSVEAVAAAFGVAPRTIRAWIDRGRIKVGKDGLVDADELLEFVRFHGWDEYDVEAVREKLKGSPDVDASQTSR